MIVDRKHIISTLRKYNYILRKEDASQLLEFYFGEGMGGILRNDTVIEFSGEEFGKDTLQTAMKKSGSSQPPEMVFYVPAQRILSIDDGRPKVFSEFNISTPYPLRMFSETLRVFIQGVLGNPDVIFPMNSRLKSSMRKSIKDTIFHDGKVVIDQSTGQRKMKLQIGDTRLPFMAWSAGQKEFMPLLLAIYCLSGPPSSVVNKSNYRWVIIEEPEMGLHPRALEAVMLEVIELMQSGYKVIISTHSSALLELVWTINNLCGNDAATIKSALCELFGIRAESKAATVFENIADKEFRTYYFSSRPHEDGVKATDISSLNVNSDDMDVSEWGGLSYFASKASEVVSRHIPID